jgi:hypothetical protein
VNLWFALIPAVVGANQLLMSAVGWCPMSKLLDRILSRADHLSAIVVLAQRRQRATEYRLHRTDHVRARHFRTTGPECTPIVDGRTFHANELSLAVASNAGFGSHLNARCVEQSPRHTR